MGILGSGEAGKDFPSFSEGLSLRAGCSRRVLW